MMWCALTARYIACSLIWSRSFGQPDKVELHDYQRANV